MKIIQTAILTVAVAAALAVSTAQAAGGTCSAIWPNKEANNHIVVCDIWTGSGRECVAVVVTQFSTGGGNSIVLDCAETSDSLE